MSIGGIPIRIHWSFFLLLGWAVYVGQAGSHGTAWAGLIWPVFLLAIFGCVLLHELGHAFAARLYNIQTSDITLYPIGGLAMLTKRLTPKQELVVALAGPAVNVVIALGLGAFLWATDSFRLDSALAPTTFLSLLLVANISLAVFNMIPAFPMDGGRVLRSVMAMMMPEDRATRIATGTGQILSLALVVTALMFGQWLLAITGFLIFLGASQELASSTARTTLEGRLVGDAMQRSLWTLSPGDTLGRASELLLAGGQSHFPVLMGDQMVGLLSREQLLNGIQQEGSYAYVGGVMSRDWITVSPDQPILTVLDDHESLRSEPAVVMIDGRLVGLLTREKLNEFVQLEYARTKGPDRRFGA